MGITGLSEDERGIYGEIMDKLKIMVSSVVRNLEAERNALLYLFQGDKFSFVELMGATPYAIVNVQLPRRRCSVSAALVFNLRGETVQFVTVRVFNGSGIFRFWKT